MPPENNQAPVVPIKIGRFKASKIIVRESWNILKQEREIMWFPVISSLTTTVALLIIGIIYYAVVLGGNLSGLNFENNAFSSNVLVYGGLLIYYIVIFFIANFFQAGLFIIVNGRFSGQNLSFSDGIRGAKAHIGKIFAWSVINATVGMILRIISDKSKLIGKIVAAVLGGAWAILTYFSLPSLVIGNMSVKDSFKESAAIIRKTWGESLIINFGVGLFFMLITFFTTVIAIGICILVPTFYVLVLVTILFVVFIIVVSIISTTLGSIFKLALFTYARTGQIPQGFSPDIVRAAVK
ncbi:MAG: DUF6159 family protein [Patescibacteria group bacterium]